MRVRRHFRTSIATIDYLITDISLNTIRDKEAYLKYCINKRMHKLNETYDNKLDRILKFLIKKCDYDNMPLESITKIIMSLSKVTNVLSKGFISVIKEDD